MNKPTTPELSMLYFYLTEGCNLACKHCWLSPPVESGPPKFATINLDHMQQAIDEGRALGLNSVKLTGGEPLMHPQIKSILELIAKERLGLNIETNGTLITDELAECISRVDGAQVSLSLDSIVPEKHDRIRNKTGAFNSTVQAIRFLVKHGTPPQVITSLLPENVNELDEIIAFVTELGASSFKLNIVQPTERGKQLQNKGELVTVEKAIKISELLQERYCGQSDILVTVTIPFAFRPLHLIHQGFVSRCGIMNILGVLPTGEYALCGIGSSIDELVFGKVGLDSLEDVWKRNPVLEKIRSDIPSNLEGICGNCTMKDICLGSCVAQNYYASQSLTAPFWFCAEADACGLFPNSRKIATT